MTQHHVSQKTIKELLKYREGALYWRVSKGSVAAGSKAGNIDTYGYLQTKINYKSYLNHRLIYLYHHGHLPEMIDHIDNDHTNNKIENLRPVTRSQNGQNRGLTVRNISGVKGVRWVESKKRWVVSIKVKGVAKTDHGTYKNIFDAACRATSVRNELHKGYVNHG